MSSGDDTPIPLHLRVVLFVLNVFMGLTNATVMFNLLYLVMSWLGVFISPFFFCFHLLDIINRSPTLQAVLMSVFYNGRQLVMTFVMMVRPAVARCLLVL